MEVIRSLNHYGSHPHAGRGSQAEVHSKQAKKIQLQCGKYNATNTRWLLVQMQAYQCLICLPQRQVWLQAARACSQGMWRHSELMLSWHVPDPILMTSYWSFLLGWWLYDCPPDQCQWIEFKFTLWLPNQNSGENYFGTKLYSRPEKGK